MSFIFWKVSEEKNSRCFRWCGERIEKLFYPFMRLFYFASLKILRGRLLKYGSE
jgi:hypothetical protein